MDEEASRRPNRNFPLALYKFRDSRFGPITYKLMSIAERDAQIAEEKRVAAEKLAATIAAADAATASAASSSEQPLPAPPAPTPSLRPVRSSRLFPPSSPLLHLLSSRSRCHRRRFRPLVQPRSNCQGLRSPRSLLRLSPRALRRPFSTAQTPGRSRPRNLPRVRRKLPHRSRRHDHPRQAPLRPHQRTRRLGRSPSHPILHHRNDGDNRAIPSVAS
jgi:hypothetical protein